MDTTKDEVPNYYCGPEESLADHGMEHVFARALEGPVEETFCPLEDLPTEEDTLPAEKPYLPLYAAEDHLQPWIAAALWFVVLLIAGGIWGIFKLFS